MARSAAGCCLFLLVLFCIGCGQQANANLNVSNHPTEIATGHDCSQTPDCFFDRYPENWEQVLYQRALAARYEARKVVKK